MASSNPQAVDAAILQNLKIASFGASNVPPDVVAAYTKAFGRVNSVVNEQIMENNHVRDHSVDKNPKTFPLVPETDMALLRAYVQGERARLASGASVGMDADAIAKNAAQLNQLLNANSLVVTIPVSKAVSAENTGNGHGLSPALTRGRKPALPPLP